MMDDRQQIYALYERMYKAMIAKDADVLRQVHAPDFVLVHMTGMRQSCEEYIRYIVNGTLNYYNAETENLDITVNGNEAVLRGRSRVTAAVFGGGRHTWRLQLLFHLHKDNLLRVRLNTIVSGNPTKDMRGNKSPVTHKGCRRLSCSINREFSVLLIESVS